MNGNEIQKFIGGIDFEDLRKQRVQLYNTITINLATARTNEEHVFTGNYIYALEGTDVDANVDLRFNELFRPNINLVKGRGVRVPFYRFYVTNAAQAGKTITLAIGIESDSFEIFDVGKALGISGNVNVIQVPRNGQAWVDKSVDFGNATTVIHTVTAGKTLYLCHSFLGVQNATGANNAGKLFVTNAADVTQYELGVIRMGSGGLHHNSPNVYIPPIEIPAGYKVKAESPVALLKVSAFIHGYEV